MAGRKVVGMSQRRGRLGCWFHTMAVLSDRAADLAGVLSGSEQHRTEARAVLSSTGLADAEHIAGPLSLEILGRLPR